MTGYLFVLLFFCTAFKAKSFGDVQSVRVTGRFLCRGIPFNNVKVKLYEIERVPFDLDDLMAEGRSNVRGDFDITGYESEYGPIEPQLNVYHTCGKEKVTILETKTCYRKFKIAIPYEYVTPGEVPNKIFDIGRIELAGYRNGEDSHDCFN